MSTTGKFNDDKCERESIIKQLMTSENFVQEIRRTPITQTFVITINDIVYWVHHLIGTNLNTATIHRVVSDDLLLDVTNTELLALFALLNIKAKLKKERTGTDE